MLPKLVVWYNTRCPICNAGINRKRNQLLRATETGEIEFRDINLEPEALGRFGADVEAVRRSLHGLDATGRLHVGADCAIEIWRRVPGRRWLGRLLGLPGFRHAARLGYEVMADGLYTWNRRKGHW